MTKMTNAQAIKVFFERDGGQKLTMAEMKALSSAERMELATLCAVELGVELEAPKPLPMAEPVAG